MELEIWQGGDRTTVELSNGEATLGGGEGDDVRIAELPASFLKLTVDAPRLTLCALETVSVGDVPFPPGVARLLLPGERVTLPNGIDLVRPAKPEEGPARAQAGTACVLRSLLTGAAEATPSNAATLVCLSGLDAGRTYPLASDSCDIGRGSGVDVRVRDRSVSRRHARVVREDERYWLEDLGAPNGAYVNGARLEGRVPLDDGAVIEVGQSVLRFTGPVTPAPAKPEPPPEEAVEAGPPVEEAAPRVWVHQLEWALIGTGAALAVIGVWVSWQLA